MTKAVLPASLSVAAALLLGGPAAAQSPRLLPLPRTMTAAAGGITIAAGATVSAETPAAAAAARQLVANVETQRGLRLAPVAAGGRIRFVADPTIAAPEGYRLTVAPAGIVVAAATAAGFVHGAATLVQLLAPDAALGRPVTVAAMAIDDAPRFGWRGLMIDVARHFQPPGEIRRIVDQMAAVKLNVLHFHLTDDQGWRFEVKRYPKLTRVGGWRRGPSTGGPAPTAPVGGFYTQAELRDLVAYAADRGITIVPEIDLPGHAQALVAAYPELGVLGDAPAVGNEWGVNPYLLNPGPAGVAFVRNVLDELLAVFPGTYIHLGGDEAVKDQWQRSPAVQAQIKALGLKDENALQSWLIDGFGRYLAAKGRRLIGWDEILEGGLPPSASVMSWRGEKGAVEAANQGHDVVLSPAPLLYLDNLQSTRGDEPPGRGSATVTLADVYAYDPLPAGLAPDKAAHVLGAQGNAWSEYLVTPHQVQHAVFPRIAAIAENGWSAAPRDFPGFVARLQPQMARWRRAGVEVADSAFAVNYRIAGSRGDALRTGRATVALETQAPAGTIRYTLDGTAPTARSRAYAAPLSVAAGTTIRAAAFGADGVAAAAPRGFDTGRPALLRRASSDLAGCPASRLWLRVPLTPEASANAPAYNIDIFDNCAAYPAAPLDHATGYRIDVARLARHYGLAHEFEKVRRHYNVTPHGELIVLAGCRAGSRERPAADAPRPVVAGTFPLPDPASAPQRMSFTGRFPAGLSGDTDLCLQFTAPTADPIYAVEAVQLTESRR